MAHTSKATMIVNLQRNTCRFSHVRSSPNHWQSHGFIESSQEIPDENQKDRFGPHSRERQVDLDIFLHKAHGTIKGFGKEK